jgi:hypothetical protein
MTLRPTLQFSCEANDVGWTSALVLPTMLSLGGKVAVEHSL